MTKERPKWVGDAEAHQCNLCSCAFTFLNRRHHCRACGQLCCGSCSSQRVNLRYLGYIGEQRVCQECYRSLQRTSTRTRSETFTSSRVVLEERMTMSDHLGRPLDKFFFTLTEHTLRWSKKKSDSDIVGSIALADALAVKKKGNFSLLIHTFPMVKVEKSNDCITRRESFTLCVLCKSADQRDSWFTELTTLIPRGLTPTEEQTHLLILLNPVSGDRSTALTWEVVEPIFRLTDFQITYRWTERSGHAQQLASVMKIQRFRAIICVGGDGTVHEVVNGLMSRPDHREAMKRVPVGVIPAGMGNGFASNFNMLDPINAAFQILQGRERCMDLLQITTTNQEHPMLYSFQSVHWGLSSEMAAAGSWSSLRIAYNGHRLYKGKLEYLLPSSETQPSFCTWSKGCEVCCYSEDHIEEEKPGGPQQNWETLENEFILVAACNLTRISSSVCVAPYAHLEDGLINLIALENCTRAQLLSLWATLDSGSFVNSASYNMSPFIKYLRVKAFRLIPADLSLSSKLTVDGEAIDPAPITSVSNYPSILTVLI